MPAETGGARPAGGLRIAIVGAESTGKTALAAALAARLQALTGLPCTWVPEWLRQWCDDHGRTPRPDEQAAIAAQQAALIDAAAAGHALVVCDTTPLMTSVYSAYLFGDHSLQADALAWQRGCALTLLMATDLPWVADGLQRDGPQVREPVDDLLRGLLIGHGLPWALVSGQGERRLEAAVDALAPLLRPQRTPGLLSRLLQRDAEEAAQRARWGAWCAECDVADCEHALRVAAGTPKPP